MPATIFSGNNVKALKSNLDLNGVTKILSVNADPASGAGVAAPLGSIAMDYLAGKVYKKTGSLDTEWQELGSGIGGINYIENSDAESGTSGWSTYADAAGSAPVDGTGGTANITWNRRVPTPPLKPLRGVADFSLVKDAVNRQGQGVSYDFTIDSADQAKILTISADYEVLSGTFATGDLAVYIIQDPAGTPVVLQPAGYQVTAGTNGNKLRLAATFQTASNVTSYRLCIHVASTSALAYTLAFDSIAVSPQQVVYGAPVTDWQSYTPTVTVGSGAITNYSVTGKYARVGDTLQLTGDITFSGTPSAFSEVFISLPAGLSIDTTKLQTGGSLGPIVGLSSALDGGIALYSGVANYSSATTLLIKPNAINTHVGTAGVFEPAYAQNFPITFGSSDRITWQAQVPILGWSSSVVVSSSTDTRVVAARYSISANRSLNNTTPINFDTAQFDTHSAVTTGSGWKFTAPVPGIYRVSVVHQMTASVANATCVYKNGSFYSFLSDASTLALSASTSIQLVAGDYIDIRGVNATTATASTANVSIERLSGPSQIAASETVAARYVNTAGTVVPTGGLGSGLVPVPFATKDYDSHGFFNGSTGVGTIPISGVYRISATQYFPSSSWTALGKAIWIRKNGSALAAVASHTPASASTTDLFLSGSVELRFNAGDTFDLNLFHNESSTRTLSTLAGVNQISIVRVGN